jgi:hypothetical protein
MKDLRGVIIPKSGTVKGSFTYHLLASFLFSSKERIMVLCNVQVQKVLVGEVLPALLAAIHVRLLVVDIIVLERLEGERLVRGQRAFHDGRGWSCGGAIQMHDLDGGFPGSGGEGGFCF